MFTRRLVRAIFAASLTLSLLAPAVAQAQEINWTAGQCKWAASKSAVQGKSYANKPYSTLATPCNKVQARVLGRTTSGDLTSFYGSEVAPSTGSTASLPSSGYQFHSAMSRGKSFAVASPHYSAWYGTQ